MKGCQHVNFWFFLSNPVCGFFKITDHMIYVAIIIYFCFLLYNYVYFLCQSLWSKWTSQIIEECLSIQQSKYPQSIFYFFFFWEEHTPPHFNLPSALKYVFNLKCFEKSHMLYNITSVRSYFFFIRHQKLTIWFPPNLPP